MTPLVSIHPDGAERLIRAVYIIATKDYLAAKKYLNTHTNHNDTRAQMLSQYRETREFLGENLAESIDRCGITSVKYVESGEKRIDGDR